MFVCVSKHQDNALKIKQEVQSVSGWDCMALSDAGLLEHSALAAIVIDLTFLNMLLKHWQRLSINASYRCDLLG